MGTDANKGVIVHACTSPSSALRGYEYFHYYHVLVAILGVWIDRFVYWTFIIRKCK
jgi:hypothetical protein